LFGHWWFEGPQFLESFIRKLAWHDQDLRIISEAQYGQPKLKLTTPTDFMVDHPTQQMVAPASSSWGEHGYLNVWLDESNSWIYPHLHSAVHRMTLLARAHASDDRPITDRVLKQLARELLLAQSSDWPFLMKTGTAKHYAEKRLIDHISRFNRLHDEWMAKTVDEDFLANCEWRDNLLPDINWRYYST